MEEEIRVTTQADVFDDHFESHEFLSPGGQLFERIASACLTTDGDIGKPGGDGKVWLLVDRSTRNSRFLAWRRGKVLACNSLGELLGAVADESATGPLEASQVMPNEEVSLLA
jgi:hypothetical protein